MPRIGIITDIHNGPDMGTKNGASAPELLKKFVSFINHEKPDAVIDLGDRVNHIDNKTDTQSLKEVCTYFDQIETKKFHIIGNHDIDFISYEDNVESLGYDFSTRVENIGGFDFVFWNADTHLDLEKGFSLKEEDFKSLEKTLENASYPTVICSHVPLNNGSMEGNFYFNKKAYPHHAYYPDEQGDRLREIIERSGKVVLCLNGHAHWNAYGCIDGIHYVTIPSLTEMFLTHPKPTSAWALLEIEDNTANIEIFGNAPMQYSLNLKKDQSHWVSMHKDYSPSEIQAK